MKKIKGQLEKVPRRRKCVSGVTLGKVITEEAVRKRIVEFFLNVTKEDINKTNTF